MKTRANSDRRHSRQGGGAALALLTLGMTLTAGAQTPFMVTEIKPGANQAATGPVQLTDVDGTLFFLSNGSDGLWRSDGTPGGTVKVTGLRVEPSGVARPQGSANIYFSACDNTTVGCEIWTSDGTTAGTKSVKDIFPGSVAQLPNSSIPVNITAVGSLIFFAASDGATGRELWKSDGTAEGTVLVKDIRSGSSGSSPTTFRAVNGLLIFEACDGVNGCEPWRSDGTAAGTYMLKDIYSGSEGGLFGQLATGAILGTQLLFAARDRDHGYEFWKTDGTVAGTVLVRDVDFGSPSGTSDSLTRVGAVAFFKGCGIGGCELWKTDGSTAGTVLVKDINTTSVFPPMPDSNPQNITDVDGIAFFYADPGNSVNGRELWKSDGTSAGTVLVKDIRPGSGSSVPSPCNPLMKSLGGQLYLTADDGSHGVELWRSDGTASGTQMVLDIVPGSQGSQAWCGGEFQVSGGRLYFTAFDNLHGEELWATRAQPTWQAFFAVDTLETPFVGDFNGDRRTDIITFTRQNPNAIGDVYVALSDGASFGANTKWHDFFAITTDETVVIGDYDGDGKDDIATWLGKSSRQVYVAKSLGTGMIASSVWVTSIGSAPSDFPVAGDANGDGKDDLIMFARTEGKVYVALSDGTKFGPPAVWHSFFAVSPYERPRVADLNGDGKVDIVAFGTDSPTAFGDVYTALSNGSQFGDKNNSDKWHDFFAIRPSETVRIGDLDGDHKEDFYTFLPPPFGQCYTAQSQGAGMGANVLWREIVTPLSTDIPFVGDVNGDGKADLIVFAQGEGRVYVSLAP